MKFLSNFRLCRRRPVESEVVRAMTTLTLAMRNDPELRLTTRNKIADSIYDCMGSGDEPWHDSKLAAEEVMRVLFGEVPK